LPYSTWVIGWLLVLKIVEKRFGLLRKLGRREKVYSALFGGQKSVKNFASVSSGEMTWLSVVTQFCCG